MLRPFVRITTASPYPDNTSSALSKVICGPPAWSDKSEQSSWTTGCFKDKVRDWFCRDLAETHTGHHDRKASASSCVPGVPSQSALLEQEVLEAVAPASHQRFQVLLQVESQVSPTACHQ